MKDARKDARVLHNSFTPTKPKSTGLEVIANLRFDTNDPHVLLAVAKWHESPRQRGERHKIIAAALRNACGLWRAAA